MKLRALATAAIAVGVMAGVASAANAATEIVIQDASYSGDAGNGNSGLDAFGQKWEWTSTLGGYDKGVKKGLAAWGSPGLGQGELHSYDGSEAANEFAVSFVNFPGVVINQAASSTLGGYDETTRFDVCTTSCVAWTPDYISANEVAFIAPTGSSLTDGESYFVNVIFKEATGNKTTGVNGYTTGFTAEFLGEAVPEPATWAMMLVGFGGMGVAMRRTRRNKVALAA